MTTTVETLRVSIAAMVGDAGEIGRWQNACGSTPTDAFHRGYRDEHAGNRWCEMSCGSLDGHDYAEGRMAARAEINATKQQHADDCAIDYVDATRILYQGYETDLGLSLAN